MSIKTKEHKVPKMEKDLEEHMEMLFKIAPDAYCICDLEGNLIDINDAAEKLFGNKKEHFIGRSVLGLLDKKQVSKAAGLLKENALGRDAGPAEFDVTRKNGKRIRVEIMTYPITFKGSPIVLGILRDISVNRGLKRELREANYDLKLKREKLAKEHDRLVDAENEIREKGKEYKELFNSSPDAIVVLDMKGKIISCNRANKVLTGYKKDELIGKHFTKLNLFSAKELPKYMKMFYALLSGKSKKPFRVSMTRKDGKRMAIGVRVGRIKKGNRLYGVQIVARDVTQSVKDRRELEDSKERFRVLSEATTDGIFIHKKFKVIDANKNLAKMLGMKVSEVIGKSLFDYISPETKTKALKNILVKNHKPYEGEAFKKDGTRFPIEIYARTIPYKGEKTRIVSIRDLTPYKKYEEEIATLAKFPSEDPNPVSRIGFNGRILYGNKACKLKLQEWDCCVGGQAPAPISNVVKKMAKDKSFKPEILNISMGSKIFKFMVIPVKEAGYANVYARDITEQKKAEEKIVSSEKQLSAVFDNNPALLILLDEERHVIKTNIETSNLAGSGIEEVMGVKGGEALSCLTSTDSSDECKFGKTCKDCIIRNTVLDTFKTGRYHNKVKAIFPVKVNGKEKIINLLVNTVPVDIGKKRLTLVALEDITELTNNENKLRDSYTRLQKTLKDTIDALATIVEAKDPYTYGHQKNVAELATAIAEEMGLDKDRIEAVNTAAMIHDIGKIGIPASILNKPGRITDVEFSLIKNHSQVGYDMIKNIEFPWPLADIIVQHHERLDGSGYPNGLKGKDIILEARIVGVADVVEAMSAHRPYRPSLGINRAIEEIEKNKGKLYDPKVVEACRRVIAKGKYEI